MYLSYVPILDDGRAAQHAHAARPLRARDHADFETSVERSRLLMRCRWVAVAVADGVGCRLVAAGRRGVGGIWTPGQMPGARPMPVASIHRFQWEPHACAS